MPKVDLIATKDFGYNTRRLKAQEPFQARNAIDAMILTRVRKVAEAPKAKPAKAPSAAEASVDKVIAFQEAAAEAGRVASELTKASPKKPAAPKAGNKARAKKAAAKK